MGHMPAGRQVNFAQEPLCSYFDECPIKEIHLLYLYFIFTSFFCSLWVKFCCKPCKICGKEKS